MKVLSIKEPFASLIKEKKKLIETRSWKTNYRGELYIHASITKPSEKSLEKRNLMSLLEDKNLNYGFIICKCNLVDCIYMTKDFINNLKQTNYQEYICGEYKEGRYAWILEDIESLKTPIEAKGQLGIWNYYNEFEIMDLMQNIEYGYVDKNNIKHKTIDENFPNNYILQTPNELIKNKVGICWDQVELERFYFKTNPYNIQTYFIVYYDNNKCPTHTFLTFEKENKFYWFEHSWEKYRGIHEYKTINDLLNDVKNKFIKDELHNNYHKENLLIYNSSKPKYHITIKEFYKHCESGKK